MTSKFQIGQKVHYTPKISGFDNSKPLRVQYITFKKNDLEEMFNVGNGKKEFNYTFFKSNLGAIETDLLSVEDYNLLNGKIIMNDGHKFNTITKDEAEKLIGVVFGISDDFKSESLIEKVEDLENFTMFGTEITK